MKDSKKNCKIWKINLNQKKWTILKEWQPYNGFLQQEIDSLFSNKVLYFFIMDVIVFYRIWIYKLWLIVLVILILKLCLF